VSDAKQFYLNIVLHAKKLQIGMNSALSPPQNVYKRP